jgi:hypothetical protein
VKQKCEVDGRWFEPSSTLDRMNTWLENPLIIKQVIQPLAKEYSTTRPDQHICPDCFQKLVDRVMAENSRSRDVLSEDELRYVEG